MDFPVPDLLIKCMKRKHAERFLREGVVHFGTPSDWIRIEGVAGKGRGDSLEGVSRGFEKSPSLYAAEQGEMLFSRGNMHYIRNERILEVPCCCFFGLSKSDFPASPKDIFGQIHYRMIIPAKYFLDFSDAANQQEYECVPEDERQVVVLIKNPREFISRMRAALRSESIPSESLVGESVTYIDMNREFSVQDPSPRELFYKDASFERQKEYRVLIDTQGGLPVRDWNAKGRNLGLGNLSDIALIEEGMYFSDLAIELLGRKIMYPLPGQDL